MQLTTVASDRSLQTTGKTCTRQTAASSAPFSELLYPSICLPLHNALRRSRRAAAADFFVAPPPQIFGYRRAAAAAAAADFLVGAPPTFWSARRRRSISKSQFSAGQCYKYLDRQGLPIQSYLS